MKVSISEVVSRLSKGNLHAKYISPFFYLYFIVDFFRVGFKKKNYFLSSGRSGTNLTLTCLSYIVRKPIGSINGQWHENNNTRLSIDYVTKLPFVRRDHYPESFFFINKRKHRLTFLTRSYKELLAKTFEINTVQDLSEKKVQVFVDRYIGGLQMYEEWNKNNRYLVFYEDLIEDLENHLLNILECYHEEPVYFNDFVLNKDEILNDIRESYIKDQKGHGGSSSGGVKKIFYAKGKDPQLLKAMEEMLRDKDPYIYDKYLKRFET